MSTTSPDLDVVVDALADAFITLTDSEQRLIGAAYRLLSHGAPVELGALAQAAELAPAEVEARLRSWPGVYIDSEARLVGLWGMAVADVSPHRARFGDSADVWMWCALDPLFIAPLLGVPATIRSTCPTTSADIRVTAHDEGVDAVDPATTVVSFLLPDGPFDVDVRQTFCHFVHFFASPAAADAWVAAHPGTFWVALPDAVEAGRRLALAAFPTQFSP